MYHYKVVHDYSLVLPLMCVTSVVMYPFSFMILITLVSLICFLISVAMGYHFIDLCKEPIFILFVYLQIVLFTVSLNSKHCSLNYYYLYYYLFSTLLFMGSSFSSFLMWKLRPPCKPLLIWIAFIDFKCKYHISIYNKFSSKICFRCITQIF